ncbi:MAG: N-6 DNA methylase [Lachnospiraceae bacterium]|nr:N-6 DNA methylase [Lachnospiraceae bacterium]
MPRDLDAKPNYIDSEEVQNFSPNEKAVWNQMFECCDAIESVLYDGPLMANKYMSGAFINTRVAAYLLYMASTYNNPFDVKLKDLLENEEELNYSAQTCEIKKHWSKLLDLLKKYQPNMFRVVASMQDLSDPFITPDSIVDLSEAILNIHEEDVFADVCCGYGTVVEDVKKKYPSVKGVGFDVNSKALALAKLRNILNGTDIDYQEKNVFELLKDDNARGKYSKIFAHYPWGLRLRDSGYEKQVGEFLTKKNLTLPRGISSEWVFNLVLTEMLSEKGKAVALMTNGNTFNSADIAIRSYFVENGLVESVIALPEKLFPRMSVRVSLVVLSHNNQGVRLVDASECYIEGRRSNEIGEEQIQTILAALDNNSAHSVFASKQELRANEYVLYYGRYVSADEEVENGIPFESLVKRITRGASVNAKELDSLSSRTPTNMQYLMISNVKNGQIDQNLPYLTSIGEKNEKYCLTNHSLILSKIGFPYKVAVSEVKEGQKIMATGNLYIVELDESKIDPYYLAAYFESEQGMASLRRISVGTAMPNISVGPLMSLLIPVPSLEQQRVASERYKAIKDEIELLRIKMEKAKDKMAHIFDEGGED